MESNTTLYIPRDSLRKLGTTSYEGGMVDSALGIEYIQGTARCYRVIDPKRWMLTILKHKIEYICTDDHSFDRLRRMYDVYNQTNKRTQRNTEI